MYLVKTKDFYEDLLTKPGFIEKFDTSNFPHDHQCYRTEREKVPGTFTDEAGGKTILEQIALRAKSYGFNMAGKETIKAKGVAKAVVKHDMRMEDYKKCLFGEEGEIDPYRNMISFRSYKHKVKTIETSKLALNRFDDKRFILKNRVDTLPWGHYRIK